MKKLENKVTIITGGSGSIGKITAKNIFRRGSKTNTGQQRLIHYSITQIIDGGMCNE